MQLSRVTGGVVTDVKTDSIFVFLCPHVTHNLKPSATTFLTGLCIAWSCNMTICDILVCVSLKFEGDDSYNICSRDVNQPA